MLVSKKIGLNELKLDNLLDLKNNYDIVKNNILIADKEACFYYIDGYLKDKMMTDIKDALLGIKSEEIKKVNSVEEFSKKFIDYSELEFEGDFDNIVLSILSGSVALIIDGFDKAIIIDIREYPSRSIEEPEDDKVLRGAKDGFIETPIINLALIRRRIRNVNFRAEYLNVGTETHNDVVLCYMSNKVNQKKLACIKSKLERIDTKSLTFGIQSLVEALFPQKWLNPFPKIKFTSRPDIASSNILEGRIILMVDNTPAVAILPTYFFDFFQEAEDYYFPPPTGNFIRFTRIFIAFFSTIITPLWILIVNNMAFLPEWLHFLQLKDTVSMPIFLQLIILEFCVEALRLASINTPRHDIYIRIINRCNNIRGCCNKWSGYITRSTTFHRICYNRILLPIFF